MSQRRFEVILDIFEDEMDEEALENALEVSMNLLCSASVVNVNEIEVADK
ncbi:MAG: hypothetical protein IKL53_00935 [Lachnospiraceae bacterium]|nr:hypothetical protein [Lachnospiraceae bacterium]